jgi:single-strand DNA-binding protein
MTDNEAAANAVVMRGRLVGAPVEKTLPSGDAIVTFRVSVPRARTAMTRGSRQTSDWVDCVAWAARVRRTVSGWLPGDPVVVEGALRRRFYRGEAGTGTRLEIEALRARKAGTDP